MRFQVHGDEYVYTQWSTGWRPGIQKHLPRTHDVHIIVHITKCTALTELADARSKTALYISAHH